MWRREMVRGNSAPVLLPVTKPQGAIESVVLNASPEHPAYAGEMPMAQTTAFIARASGPLGSNRSYPKQPAARLHVLDIDDPCIAQLMH